MPSEFYKKYRPKTFKEIRGQPEACKTLHAAIKARNVPHSILFSGPSGTGKTTMARLMATKLGCSTGFDFIEVNAASNNGIGVIRGIEQQTGLAAVQESRVWVFDEAHELSTPAQNALLKILEDTPSCVYFFLCTTHPDDLLPTIRNRCTNIEMKPLNSETMRSLLVDICNKEKLNTDEKVINRIIDVAEGSARRALVLLEQIMTLTPDEAIKVIQSNDVRQQAVEIVKALLRPGTTWPEMAKIIKSVDEDAEKVRRLILAYTTTVMLGQPKPGRAFYIIQAFRDSFFACGKAGLVAGCFEVVTAKP